MQKKINILILEDNKDDAELTIWQLKKAKIDLDYKVVADKKSFIDEIKKDCYDVIISDYNLPQFNGIEALELLQENKREIPFILVSGAIGEDLAVAAVKKGAFDYILKNNLIRIPQSIENAINFSSLSKEKKTSHEAILQSEERYRKLAKTFPDIIVEIDIDGIIIWSNDNGLDFFGPNLIGSNFKEHFLMEQNTEIELKKISALISNASETITIQNKIKRFDNEYKLVEWKCVYLESTTTKTIICTGRDISDTKENEKKLLKALEELKKTNQDLEKFADFVSNHLQEPLKSITNFLQLLKEKLNGNLDQDSAVFLKYAETAAERMSGVISALVQFYKISNETVEMKAVDLNHVVRTSLANLRNLILESKANISYDELPVVKANEVLAEKLFDILIENAIRYKGSENPIIKIKVSPKNKNEIIIDDNGLGIESEYHKKIFEMFFRLHSYDDIQGAGVGLALAKKIIENHLGTIRVESAPGKGSAFYVGFGEVL